MNTPLTPEGRFGAVVVPVDGSERAEAALVPARALAGAANVPIVFFRWIEEPDAAREAQAALSELSSAHDDVETHVSLATADDGNVAEALVAVAASRDALVCMASHGRTRVGKAVLGSVTADVVASSPRPVLVVGPAFDPSRPLIGQRLGICLDGSSFAEGILPLAMGWAEAFGLRPWLLESANPADVADLARAPSGDVMESGYVRRVATRFPTAVEWDVLHARHPADAIVAYAKDHPVGVLAMATHGRTGWSRMSEGSVALQVLHRSPCALLLLHPADTAGAEQG